MQVLEWLIQHQSSAGDDDIVESVGGEQLDILVSTVDHLLVLFHDGKKKSRLALDSLEGVDDDCDRLGVSFVEVKCFNVSSEDYGIYEDTIDRNLFRKYDIDFRF